MLPKQNFILKSFLWRHMMDLYDEVYEIKDGRDIDSPTDLDVSSALQFINNKDDDDDDDQLSDDDMEEEDLRKNQIPSKIQGIDNFTSKKSARAFRKLNSEIDGDNSDSSLSASDEDKDSTAKLVDEVEFNPKLYENIDAPSEIKELMQYISRYTPQRIAIDNKLKIFIPEYMPSSGDIDAFLKIIPPKLLNDKADVLNFHKKLGLDILDEPSGEQSDPVLLQMKLRSIFTKKLETPSAIAKSPKDIDRWITEIQSLHANSTTENVVQKPISNIDNLMSEWPEEVEKMLDTIGFPPAYLNCTLSEYIQIVCNIFDIPLRNPKLHSDVITALHTLFSLFTATNQKNIA